jgi:hypothetical protein
VLMYLSVEMNAPLLLPSTTSPNDGCNQRKSQ